MADIRTEVEIAEKIANGSLPSPAPFGNMWLVNLRITGTGLAYRVGLEEIVWRDPEMYLNDAFLMRCNGLPVIENHPADNVLTDDAFKKRIVGTVMLPYIRGSEVWAVCRIYDKALVAEIMKGGVSTSPGVVFNEQSGNIELEGEDDNLLIEGKPYLIDHIALVMPDHGSLGVWDKNQIPEGIELTSIEENFTMDEENQTLLANLIKGAIADSLKPVQNQISRINARMDAAGICDARGDESEETRRRHEREGEEHYERTRDDARGDESEETRRRHEREGEERYERRRDDARGDESEETRRRHESEGMRDYHERQRRNARGDESEETRRRHEREGEERYERSRGDDSMSEKDIRAEISRLEKKLRREDRDSEHEREGMERYERSRDDFQNESVHFEKEPKVIEQLRRANANEHGRDEGAARRDSRHDDRRDDRRDDARGDADFDGMHIDVRDDERMSEARSRADAAFMAIGKEAPIPFRGESSLSYRRRALAVMQKHSKVHKDVNIRAIGDSAALSVIEEAIYKDARAAVEHQMNNTRGQLVPLVRNDEAGRRIVEYKGDVNAWLSAFKQSGRVMSKINTHLNQRG